MLEPGRSKITPAAMRSKSRGVEKGQKMPQKINERLKKAAQKAERKRRRKRERGRASARELTGKRTKATREKPLIRHVGKVEKRKSQREKATAEETQHEASRLRVAVGDGDADGLGVEVGVELECHGVGQLPLLKGQRAEQGWAKKESKMRRRPPAGNKRETRTIKIQQQQQRHVENGLHNRSRGSTRKQTKQNKPKKLTHFKAKRRRGGAAEGDGPAGGVPL